MRDVYQNFSSIIEFVGKYSDLDVLFYNCILLINIIIITIKLNYFENLCIFRTKINFIYIVV